MKFRDMPHGNLLLMEKGYIHERWAGMQGSVRSSFKRVVEYIFVLNTGGVVATAAYMATKPASVSEMKAPMWCFITGVISITLHAAWDYYRCETLFKKYRSNVQEFIANKIDW